MSALYASIQQAMLSSGFTWAGADIAAVLVDPTYTPDFATDTTLANVPSTAPLCFPTVVPSPVSAGGVAGGANITFTGVDTTKVMQAVLLVVLNTGTPSASLLVAYIDGGVGFGVQPLATSVELVWDSRGIFAP